MSLLIKNCYLLDDNNELNIANVFIKQGVIKDLSYQGEVSPDVQIIDAMEQVLLPGFIDVHTHLRYPGQTHKEDLLSGSLAAAAGGYTTICCMPNTTPTVDRPEIIKDILAQSKQLGITEIRPIGAISKELQGEVLNDFQELKMAGAFAVSDDGNGIQSSEFMEKAMIEAKRLNLALLAHCEDYQYSRHHSFSQGVQVKATGEEGQDPRSEYLHIKRDIELVQKIGVHYHVCHISTKEGVAMVAQAKKEGLHVTCEVTPHHLVLGIPDIHSADPQLKMNPPLRRTEDIEALIAGLQDGTIDMIATDHAPHHKDEKSQHICCAPFGVIGLETAFAVLYTRLVLPGHLTFKKLVDLMGKNASDVFNMGKSPIEISAPANLTLVNIGQYQKVNTQDFYSKSRNCPFENWSLTGWPVLTIFNGEVVYQRKN